MSTAKKMSTDIKPIALYKGLEFIESAFEQQKLIEQAAEHLWDCLVQVRGREEKFSAKLIQFHPDDGGFTVQLVEPERRAQFYELAKASPEGPECLVLIYSKKQFLNGVQTELNLGAAPEGKLRFFPPKKMFKMQRRGDLRLVVSRGYDIRAEFGLEVLKPRKGILKFRFQVLDVSKGGIGLYVPNEADFKRFEKDLRVLAIQFSLQTRPFSANGVVRSTARTPMGKGMDGFRVGIQFQGFNLDEADWLETYIITQSAYALM